MGAQCVLQGNEQARRERYAVRGGVGLRCKKMPVQSAGETTKEKAEPGTRIASRLSLADLRYKKDISTNACSFIQAKEKSPNANCVQTQSGAGGGGRTRTLLPGLDFESSTSANSITPAKYFLYYTGSSAKKQAKNQAVCNQT